MDNNYNQETNVTPNQQGNPYQQQGIPYQQGNPYQQQGAPYQQGNPYQQQGTPYQQGNPYQQQGAPYQQGNFYQQQGNPYQQSGSYTNNGYGNYGGNAEEAQKAPNIFQQFGLSFIPPQYNRLTKVKTGSMIGFVTLLALVATIISFINFAISFASLDIEGWVNELPDFEIKNGRLYLEEEFLYDEGEIFVYVTEDIDDFSYDDAAMLMDEGYNDILLVGRDRLSLMQNGEYQQFDFDTATMDISRDLIVDTLVPMIMVFIIIGYIIFFVGRVCWYFLCAAIYLLFGLLIALIMKKQLSTEALYKTAVYAKVLMFVVVTVLSIIPLEALKMPFYIRVVITLVFMGFAIAKLPDQNQWHQA